MVVTKAGRFYVQPFITERVVTQGDPVFPTVFDIVVGALVRTVLM